MNIMSTSYDLICAVVNYGQGSKLMKTARRHGVSGGTIILGKGTRKGALFDLFALGDVRKEVLLMVCETTIIDEVLRHMDEKCHFNKPHHGIAFIMPVSQFMGCGHYAYEPNKGQRGVHQMEYDAIITIVDRGKGEEVVEVSARHGAQGATIINARGAGTHEIGKVFNIEVEPEKDYVLILTARAITEQVATGIRDGMSLDTPGNGILFIQPVSRTYGIHE